MISINHMRKTLSSPYAALALGTAIGAYGHFPKPPKIFTRIAQSSALVPYVLLFTLMWQSGNNPTTRVAIAAYLTVILFLATYVLDAIYDRIM